MEKFDSLASQQLSQQPSQTEKAEESESASVVPDEPPHQERQDAANENALKALQEIGALKSEIQKLTSSLQQSTATKGAKIPAGAEASGDKNMKKEDTESTFGAFPSNNLLTGHRGAVIHTDRASSKLSSEMHFNINQKKQGGHINNLHRLDLTHLETISVQNQLNELEENGRLQIEEGRHAGGRAEEEGTGMLKSFLTDGRGDKPQNSLSQDKYERIRQQAELEVRQEHEDDDKSQEEDENDLINFYRNKKNDSLQESELAPEPRPFPGSFNQLDMQREREISKTNLSSIEILNKL